MLKSIIVLPDGTRLSSGPNEANPIMKVTLTEVVNAGDELTLGSACAAILEANILAPHGNLTLAAGDKVTLYKVDEAGVEHKKGVFILEKPSRVSANAVKLTGYDRMIELDKDLTTWLNELEDWPYSLHEFAGMVCDACGLSLVTADIPNADFPVPQFKYPDVTGRQLMKWIGEICGCFCRANADGNVELAWYTPSGKTITPSGDYRYFAKGLSYETYTVDPIEAVQLKLADSEDGALWPAATEDAHSYVISGNPILLADVSDDLEPYLEVIRERLAALQYTPCKVSLPANLAINAGSTVEIIDSNGDSLSACVMHKVSTGQKDMLQCTGSRRRDSASAVNNKTPGQIAQGKADAAALEAKKAAAAALESYAQTVTADIENLQKQIDGQIQSWFYDYVPTADNFPASEWTTEAKKNEHLGDLFYIVDNETSGGQTYRWAMVNDSYKWVLVEDSDVSKALAMAAQAQDTADGKRRVFVAQPVPPYDAGDLWTDGADLRVCKTTRSSGSYNSSDWTLATDYIDSTEAGKIAAGKVAAQTQADIFNKLTNNGKLQGLYMYDGLLYINASYIKSGQISADYIDAANLKVSAANITGSFVVKNTSGATLLSAGDNKVQLAGWDVDNNSIRNGNLGANGSMWLCRTGTSVSPATYGNGGIGDTDSTQTGWCITVGNKFGVLKDGVLYAKDADIQGKISADKGIIAGWTINESSLRSNQASITSTGTFAFMPNGNGATSVAFALDVESNSYRLIIGRETAIQMGQTLLTEQDLIKLLALI